MATLVDIDVARGMRRQESGFTLRFGFGLGMDSHGQGDVSLRLKRCLDEIILKGKGAELEILMTGRWAWMWMWELNSF